uniref:Uncharacterized protein n=1 Tax=Sphaerodactylus townsendi TaxID=933632 RepID=A0ACB8EXH8_9SAUR
MRWAGALLLLAALGSSGGTRGCPLQLRGCKCVDDRPKGLAMPGAARKRVSCSGQDLGEPPAPRFLPNGTVTLIPERSVRQGYSNCAKIGDLNLVLLSPNWDTLTTRMIK